MFKILTLESLVNLGAFVVVVIQMLSIDKQVLCFEFSVWYVPDQGMDYTILVTLG